MRIDTRAEEAIRLVLVTAADRSGSTVKRVARQGEADGNERLFFESPHKLRPTTFVPKFSDSCSLASDHFGSTSDTTYRSSSKDEGMGASPEAESGIGARDMSG